MPPSELSAKGSPSAHVGANQIDSRSAFAAACRRSLTSASSRAARSMRSCCASARACWSSARLCWLSVCSPIALSCLSITATVRVRSASCPATLAMSSSAVTTCRILRRARSGPGNLPERSCRQRARRDAPILSRGAVRETPAWRRAGRSASPASIRRSEGRGRCAATPFSRAPESTLRVLRRRARRGDSCTSPSSVSRRTASMPTSRSSMASPSVLNRFIPDTQRT